MSIAHNLGFPRIGADRELKKATEAFWQNKIDHNALEETSRELRLRHWQLQADAGIDLIPVGDFSSYDQMLDMSCLLGVVPPRFNWDGNEIDHSTYFAMARGKQTGTEQQGSETIAACEMTKWFDTNYHYLVPEVHKNQQFKPSFNKLFNELAQAQSAGINSKAVIIGPLTWLWLAKVKGETFDKLQLIEPLIEAYRHILARLKDQGVKWVQIDEPVLVLDLPDEWKASFTRTYPQLQTEGLNILLATYFGPLEDNLELACALPVEALHIDAVRGSEQIDDVLKKLPENKILSLGVIDGRNIWRTDLDKVGETLKSAKAVLAERLWIAPSCSLLHVPVDLDREQKLDSEIKNWLAFAKQKLHELKALKQVLNDEKDSVEHELQRARKAVAQRHESGRIHHIDVKQRVASITENMLNRSSVFKQRSKLQKQWLKLPAYPTTTIGSFPQTNEIRIARRDFKQGRLNRNDYIKQMQEEISHVVEAQEKLGLDVLVHGEPERNDMVEYFGELLNGFAFTQFAWVQSYGSRCVKPPIIYGDISRPQAMTVEWSHYAQSCTDKPMKGMLTGPVTILNWSFVRDDQPRAETAAQIALALRDEVHDLEQAGIKVIQIDEAALREGLPLRMKDWEDYLSWTVRAFRLTASVAADDTQIHTHMCYSEFNDIIQAIADMDADVITIETSRSDMELLDVFENFDYPNDIGPGVYDIHSPNVPTTQHIVDLMQKATKRIPVEQLWINPDCGLKTRKWPEVNKALARMVESAQQLRKNLVADAAQA
ncbi:5-methyltetrahydropteroyltriglutamate--homocysteine methyltransferase [hydrothermal vent metagenome]|uniref:5-methyltetrahydropteroyltriglutamate--homocysteine S-methyltransferase n=1 Tax=hydrothermal vent metagenome TaxID=652676 RepID=A0A3B0WU09_9ZZZZ